MRNRPEAIITLKKWFMVCIFLSSCGCMLEVAKHKKCDSSWSSAWTIIWHYQILLSLLTHWKPTDLQFSGFIASSACNYKIIAHTADVSKLLGCDCATRVWVGWVRSKLADSSCLERLYMLTSDLISQKVWNNNVKWTRLLSTHPVEDLW